MVPGTSGPSFFEGPPPSRCRDKSTEPCGSHALARIPALPNQSETVTAVDAAEYRIDARRQARTAWRGDAVKMVHREQWLHSPAAPDQRDRTIATSDGGCANPRPLKVGQSFECSELTTWPKGWTVRYDLKFKVEAAESVQTPAGTFDTLRLVGKGFVENQTTNTVSRHERILWLAPAVKREVKHELRTVLKDGQVFKVEGRELVSFKAGSPP